MASEKLTVLKVMRARAPGLLNDGKGLSLRIAGGGTKSWVFRFMLAGRAREMGLGSVADVTLAEARDLRATLAGCASRASTRSKLAVTSSQRNGSSEPKS